SFNFNTSFISAEFFDLSSGADTWQWNFGDGNTSNLQNPTHIFPGGGSYEVTLTITGICGTSTFSDSVHVGVNGIEDISSFDFSIYPNPSNGIVTIKTNLNMTNTLVQIMDATGRIVHATSLNGSETFLNLESLESGTYFIRLTHDGRVANK